MHMLASGKHTQCKHDVITTHHRRRHLHGESRTRLAVYACVQVLGGYLCSMTCVILCRSLRETTGIRALFGTRTFPYPPLYSRYFLLYPPFSIPGASTP